jgi:hypothetical protein
LQQINANLSEISMPRLHLSNLPGGASVPSTPEAANFLAAGFGVAIFTHAHQNNFPSSITWWN